VSGYRIDLGIRSVDGSRYDLGIECDGYTYHSTPTARDRDWLRQQVLEGLGWCIHRIWSTAWVRDPEAEIRRLEEALASSRSRQGAAQVPPGALRQRPNIEARRIDSDLELDSESEAELFRPYQQASLDDIKIGPGLQEEAYIKLFLLVQRVVETEGPVHFDVVVDRVRVRYGLGRAGRLIRERVQKAVRRMVRETALSRLGKGGEMQFLCIGGAAVEPRRVDGASGRRIDQVALAELRVGIVRILQASYGSSLEELIEEAARQFGYRRTGGQIVDRLRKALDELLGAGVAVESFGQVTLAEPETDGAQT
jgi:hypothetical protein